MKLNWFRCGILKWKWKIRWHIVNSRSLTKKKLKCVFSHKTRHTSAHFFVSIFSHFFSTVNKTKQRGYKNKTVKYTNVPMHGRVRWKQSSNMISVFHNLSIYLFIYESNLLLLSPLLVYFPFVYMFKYNKRRNRTQKTLVAG